MTKGQFLIGNFNPNEDVGVERIKALATELIDEIDASSNEYVCNEAKQLKLYTLVDKINFICGGWFCY